MAAFRIVITDAEYNPMDIEKKVLRQIDAELVLAQCRTEAEVIEAAREADGILNQYAPVTAGVINQLERCKVISRYGVGIDTIDAAAATRRGIIVSNCTDYCLDEVADHAMALILAWTRKIPQLTAAVKADDWSYMQGGPMYRLRGRVLGLIGFGKIAQNLAAKAKAFGLHVLACDPYLRPETAREHEVDAVDLDTLCGASDYVSVHVPLMAETRGLLGAKQFERMKPETVVINTSRGPVIDETALIEALHSSRIGGAALDVLETEPIHPGNPLLGMDQVILTPHAAWYSEESEHELRTKATQNIVDVLLGFFPAYLANPDVKKNVLLQEK